MNTAKSGSNELIIKNSYDVPLLFRGTRVKGLDKSVSDSSQPFSLQPLIPADVQTSKIYSYSKGTLEYTQEKIIAFVLPGEQISCRLADGYYSFEAYTGENWFGKDELFGTGGRKEGLFLAHNVRLRRGRHASVPL